MESRRENGMKKAYDDLRAQEIRNGINCNQENKSRRTLKLKEPHPAIKSALKFIASIPQEKPWAYQAAFSSNAIEGNRLAEICGETLYRLLNKKPVSDRYLLGLAWELKAMTDDNVEIENKKLRKILWLAHLDHFKYLYGDDGEMQCPKCLIDFKRDPIEKIERQFMTFRSALATCECDGRCTKDPEKYSDIACVDCCESEGQIPYKVKKK